MPIADSLDRSKLHFVDVDGVNVRYYEDGDGEPLLLFSGGEIGTLDGLDRWSLNLPGLAERFHVFCIDKLGQGHTGNPPQLEDYTFEYQLQHTHRLIEKLGLSQVNIAGQSRGALLVTRLTLDHPGLVKNLIIVDSATLSPENPMFPSLRWYENIFLGVPQGPPTRESVRLEMDGQAYSREQITDDYVDRMLEIAQLPKFQEAQATMAEIRHGQWLPSINRVRSDTVRMIDDDGIPVPTLVIWGINDLSAPLPLGQRLFERIAATTPHAEMHVLNGAGHYSYREQPAAFNRIVKSFCLDPL
ncbi:MAG: alpha/beta hydrolase [Chloroflexi bacterium]|nr:alpha/beta hydrolase [Chloroflexota bacterium]MYB84922.1 alpha/beta hydrolase [Chloroflexota bacterium]